MQRILLLLLILSATLTSCRKDFSTEPSTGNLEFSKTTVYLDTVFTGTASSTYQLKVYNRSDKDISIPTIALGKGDASKYRIMVDGMTGENGKGKSFKNVEILANDSLYVFIEETADIIDANPSDLLYTDQILFDAGSNQQKVDLVTLIQDAIFLFPDRTSNGQGGYTYEQLQLDNNDPNSKIYGFELSGSELHFTNAKPYVIYGYAGVKAGDILQIDPGARIHFHDQSGIFVKNGGSIQAIGDYPSPNGSLQKEIIFEGDRLEPGFAEVPGQWGIIYLAEGSTNNIFDHVTIKNATVGIFVDRDDTATTTQIKNTQIYNSSSYGIVARKGKINGENIVVNKAGISALACILGGSYDFTHCTFANYWTGSSRQTPAVYLDNTYRQDDTLFVADLAQANFTNCIIFGSNNVELGLNRDTSKNFLYSITNCLIRFNDPANQLSNNPLYTPFLTNSTNLISNNSNPRDPKFKNVSKNQMQILSNSSVIGKGVLVPTVNLDILNNLRTNPTDLGAYNFVP